MPKSKRHIKRRKKNNAIKKKMEIGWDGEGGTMTKDNHGNTMFFNKKRRLMKIVSSSSKNVETVVADQGGFSIGG